MKDRPPVVIVARDGDPAGALAVAVITEGVSSAVDPEPALALSGIVEARLVARGFSASVVPAWDGYRVSIVLANAAAAKVAVDAVRAALATPVQAADVDGATKKLTALSARRLPGAALARWARCVGSPYLSPSRTGKVEDGVTPASLESWRKAAHGLGRVAIAVAGPRALGESVADSVLAADAWASATPVTLSGPLASSADVYESTSPPNGEGRLLVHATLDMESGSAAVTTAEALGDPHGPLAARLDTLEVPFRLREVAGTAHMNGGCVGIVLETTKDAGALSAATANRVADAVALVETEARVRLGDGTGLLDGRTLASLSGDARDAAERAAFWGVLDAGRAEKSASSFTTSVALGVSARRTAPRDTTRELSPSRDDLASALKRATASWEKPVVEGRTRVEPGQGDLWVLFASPCGTDAETDKDAGLTALFVTAAAAMATRSPDVRVEPWIGADGAGLLVHGSALTGESPSRHAKRLTDVVARNLASEPLSSVALTRARTQMLRYATETDGHALGVLANALAPQHPSWFLPTGRDDALSRVSDAAVLARAETLRHGPFRIALLANTNAEQGEVALRAADRWVERRDGEARACRTASAGPSPKAGTLSVEPAPFATPEAYLAFPFPEGDDVARSTATVLATALDGPAGLLEKALSGGLARSSSARVLGWPRSPALVIRIVSPQANLDAAVMQTRALLDRLRQGATSPADLERASKSVAEREVESAFDPRTRVVATWRSERIASPGSTRPAPTLDAVRAFAAKYLAEDAMVVVAARPGRSPAPKTP